MPTMIDRASRSLTTTNVPRELPLFVSLLALFNLHLVSSLGMAPLHFHPELVLQGEWWRVITHPFVHVSTYHLALDASAFLVLYATLQQRSTLRRLAYCAGSAGGSLALALLLSPNVNSIGLCGLSGIAHGLMAITGLEIISQTRGGNRIDSTMLRIGWITLLAVTAKGLYEAMTGQFLFIGSHFGSIGTPIPACHLGGVIGGSIVYWLLSESRSEKRESRDDSVTRRLAPS